jgi:predicted Zn-dependent protease
MIAGAGGGVVYVYNLEEVPITRRLRFNLLSPETEKELAGGAGQYEATLQEFRGKILPSDHHLTKLVAQVVERLLPTTGGLAGDDWRVHVIEEPNEKNAFVMPGGKVFVFTGILPICQDEAGVAAVLGHEIAHNVAHHVAERLSRASFTMIFTLAFSLILGLDSGTSNSVVNLLLSLPNSRTQEAEADHIGLFMMAEACYDPQEAVAFWERMKKAEQFQPPEFLSTHPSSYNRIDHIKQWLPEAQSKYADRGCGSLGQFARDFTSTVGQPSSGRRQQIATRPSKPDRREDDDFF